MPDLFDDIRTIAGWISAGADATSTLTQMLPMASHPDRHSEPAIRRYAEELLRRLDDAVASDPWLGVPPSASS